MAGVPKIANITLRGLQLLWTILIMALVGNMIANAISGNPSVVNYGMFVAVISMLSLFYLFAATINEKFAILPSIMIAVDGVNTLFFFCGAIAFSAELHVGSCGDPNYVNNNYVTFGSYNNGQRCHEAQAVTAFLWFGFISYAISAGLDFLQNRGGSSRSSGGSRPAMSQM